MGRPQLYTKNGHSMYDMVSLLQKAIRSEMQKLPDMQRMSLEVGTTHTSGEDCWQYQQKTVTES